MSSGGEGSSAAGGDLGNAREPGHTIWSVGHSNRSLEEFVELLRGEQVERVVDVRRWPRSRFAHFCRDELATGLGRHDIDYRWLGEQLGGYRSGGYERHMRSEEFAQGLDELQRLAWGRPTSFICAEKLPWRCHRMHIADALVERGWEVLHLIEPGRTWQPTARQETMDL